MRIKHIFYCLVMPIVRLYWRIAKPKTFGVKVLLLHPDSPEKVLLIRHTYGQRSRWNIPGGGYTPTRERAKDAAEREVREELGVSILNLEEIGVYRTSAEGKQDTVTIFRGMPNRLSFQYDDGEISETIWDNRREISDRTDVANVVKHAVHSLRSSL
jgi:ADP-ribose pyrophosphatase YjhB (NUDIX family)